VIHSLLTTRVLLDIRTQAGNNLDSSPVLTELTYNPPRHLSEDQA
jgi:hypothetical protein